MTSSIALPEPLVRRLADTAQAFGIPGLALALVAPGRRALWLHGKDLAGSARPVGASTWFSVASLGKHVTAAAVLRLAQEGLVDLQASIGSYLADVPSAWAGRRIAALLRHTSGLPEYLSYTDADAVPEQRAEFMRRYGHLAPAFDEGAGWIYTNTNYILLGMLVAQLAGQSFAASVQALFDEAGIQGATVASPEWTRQANAAGLGTLALDAASVGREVIGDGDVSFTAGGMLGWLESLIDANADDRAPLDSTHRNEMFRPMQLATGRPSPYGCGWFLDRLGNQRISHHAGHYDGWTAVAYLAPEAGCAVAAMCNLAPGNTRAVRHLAQQALEAFEPGSTLLSLAPIEDDDPALSRMVRAQLLRQGDALDLSCFADELKRVAAHGSKVRSIINLWTGQAPARFELVQRRQEATHQLRHYRLSYPERTEHLLVGVTPERTIHWAWPL